VVAHGLEREGLFQLLRKWFAPETILYPGCFLHVTPSFWLQHVVYVDRHDRDGRFFANEEGVRRFVNARRHYRPPAYLRFLPADYTQPLPLPGNGLGLAICQSIVLAHGGLIHVSDRPGGGTRFSVLIPTHVETAAYAPIVRVDRRRCGVPNAST
jgi:Histidine kinase-, DNA gyrase B-, and HSP90-like ATPase